MHPTNSLTPFILITSVPAPLISAPIEFKKLATSTTWGSFATFSKTVVPSAIVAAIITFIVAPTDTTSKKMFAAFKLSASTKTAPCSIVTLAPKASKPFMCWSIGLTPIGHPPGNSTLAFLNLASKDPMK